MDIKQAALLRYLAKGDGVYLGKVLELRDSITEWLNYIPQTFPHYTRHTVGHSEQIIWQLSSLLFRDSEVDAPSLALSQVEAFILCVAAYLHDSGMVCADAEKRRILETTEWNEWVSEGGGGAKRWSLVNDIRSSPAGGSPDVANFIADVQARFLIAEFIRARHHLRGGDVINEHESTLGRFAFNDPILRQTIADVCVAHGLARGELEDSARFPQQRDIRGEKTNVRLLAILFRLGDLLDMSSDRACPILLNAACPIPSHSLAHWTQYQRITHRNTSPDAIEIRAFCSNQDEHRVLVDWCQWIVDEVSNAAIVMPHATRHANWKPPMATLDGPNPTITIRPASYATYIPSNWRLELDQAQIIERLIHDAYGDPIIFIRELLQNALDATRCRVYEALHSASQPLPTWPVDIPAHVRDQFPVRLSIEELLQVNPLSGEQELKQVVVVDDLGTGMNQDIIERYLLQIGRSYYRSPEFHRQFPFNPTSQFGIGFLSTFAVSDEIRVDTFQPGPGNAPVRLTLTGPRNYLLVERSSRTAQGTRIEVVMRQPLAIGEVVQQVQRWCRRVEFPIILSGMGEIKTITAETPEAFFDQSDNAIDPEERFSIRCRTFRGKAGLGEIYLFVSTSPVGERWDRYGWARFTYPKLHPMARAPELPDSLTCLHGIAVSGNAGLSRGLPSDIAGFGAAFSIRLDLRSGDVHSNLSRSAFGDNASFTIARELKGELARMLDEHLDTSPLARDPLSWKYKQRLMEAFAIGEYWRAVASTVPLLIAHRRKLASIHEVQALPRFVSIYRHRAIQMDWHLPNNAESQEQDDVASTITDACLLEECIGSLSNFARETVFAECVPVRAAFYSNGILAVHWSRLAGEDIPIGFGGYRKERPGYLVPFDGATHLGTEAHPTTEKVYGPTLLNENHPFSRWLARVSDSTTAGEHVVTPAQISKLLELLGTPIRHAGFGLNEVERYLRPWRQVTNMPEDLRPPPLEKSDFVATEPPRGPRA